MKKIKIKIGEKTFEAELNETRVAKAIWEKLPIKADFDTWGEEIYFSIPVEFSEGDLEDPKAVVKIGDLGYWPLGPAFCIFYGRTPISAKNEIKPADPVEVIGKFYGEPSQFKKVDSSQIIIEKF